MSTYATAPIVLPPLPSDITPKALGFKVYSGSSTDALPTTLQIYPRVNRNGN